MLEKIDELETIMLGKEVSNPAFAWLKEKFDDLRELAAFQQRVQRTALPVRVLNAICYGWTIGTILWLLFGSR